MMTYDSGAPARIVMSFLTGSPEKSLTLHLGSDTERRKKNEMKEREKKRETPGMRNWTVMPATGNWASTFFLFLVDFISFG